MPKYLTPVGPMAVRNVGVDGAAGLFTMEPMNDASPPSVREIRRALLGIRSNGRGLQRPPEKHLETFAHLQIISDRCLPDFSDDQRREEARGWLRALITSFVKLRQEFEDQPVPGPQRDQGNTAWRVKEMRVAAEVGFPVDDSKSMLKLGDRRNEALENLHCNLKTLQRIENDLLDYLALWIFHLEHVHRRKKVEDVVRRGRPLTQEDVEWVREHPNYAACWTAMYLLWVEVLTTLLHRKDRPGDGSGYMNLIAASLWRFAELSTAQVRHQADYGMIWLSQGHRRMEGLAQLNLEMGRFGPFYQVEISWIRGLSDVAGELSPFVTQLLSTDVGREFIDRWKRWLEGCSCEDPSRPEPSTCDVHTYLQLLQLYLLLFAPDEDIQVVQSSEDPPFDSGQA